LFGLQQLAGLFEGVSGHFRVFRLEIIGNLKGGWGAGCLKADSK
jgi:hypothetical protein